MLGIFHPSQVLDPRWWILRSLISLQFLIEPLCLSIGGLYPDMRPTATHIQLQISFQNCKMNWGPQSYTMTRKAMDSKHIIQQDFCHFFGVCQFWQSNKMSHFNEPFHHCQNCGVSLEDWTNSTEISANGWLPGDQERFHQSLLSMGGGLVFGTNKACLHILLDLLFQGGPSESLPYGNIDYQKEDELWRVSLIYYLWRHQGPYLFLTSPLLLFAMLLPMKHCSGRMDTGSLAAGLWSNFGLLFLWKNPGQEGT